MVKGCWDECKVEKEKWLLLLNLFLEFIRNTLVKRESGAQELSEKEKGGENWTEKERESQERLGLV